jgi:type IV secretory pathway VirB3-like protein
MHTTMSNLLNVFISCTLIFLFENSILSSFVVILLLYSKCLSLIDFRFILLLFSRKERTPMQQYIRKLIYDDLNRATVVHVLRKLRKLNWDQDEVII